MGKKRAAVTIRFGFPRLGEFLALEVDEDVVVGIPQFSEDRFDDRFCGLDTGSVEDLKAQAAHPQGLGYGFGGIALVVVRVLSTAEEKLGSLV